MNWGNFGDNISHIIALLAAIYATLLGFGVISLRTPVTEANEKKMNSLKNTLKILGPIIIVFDLLFLFVF